MKEIIRLIPTFLVSVTFVNFSFANYIFEVEIGRYMPNDNDFGGDASIRLGGVLANDFGPIEVYGGYKIWTNEYDDVDFDDNGYILSTNLHTIVVGARKKIPLSNGKNIRFGGEVLIATANYGLTYINSNYSSDDYTVNDMKSIGFGIEAGAVYKVEKYEFFGGINLLILEYEAETIDTPSGTSTASTLLSASEIEYDANGINYKLSIGYSF